MKLCGPLFTSLLLCVVASTAAGNSARASTFASTAADNFTSSLEMHGNSTATGNFTVSLELLAGNFTGNSSHRVLFSTCARSDFRETLLCLFETLGPDMLWKLVDTAPPDGDAGWAELVDTVRPLTTQA